MNKGCLNCGKDVAHLKAGAKFCHRDCRNQYNYRKRNKTHLLGKGHKGDDSLKGVILPNPEINLNEEINNEVPKLKVEKNDVPPLRNTFWINNEKEETEEQRPEENTEREPIDKTPPPVFLEKITQTANSEHEKYSLLLKGNEERQGLLLKKIKSLEDELKQQEGRNGNDLVTMGLIGGGVLGLLYKSDEEEKEEGDMILSDKKGKKLGVFSKKGKRKKSFREEETPWHVHLRNVLIGGAIGLGVGYLGKLATEKQREADKQKKIALIKNELSTLEEQQVLNEELIKSYRSLKDQEPEFLKKVERKPNPDYELFLQKQKSKGGKPLAGFDENGEQKENGFVPKSKKISSAKDFGKEPMQMLNFEGAWEEFFDKPSVNFHCLIHGNAGEGKSTLCLWFARYLAENFGRVLYVSGEEGKNPTFQNKIKFCKAGVDDLYISDIRTGEEFLKEVAPHEFNFIVFDSLLDMNIDAAMMKEIWLRFPNTGFIAIEQNNKSGDMYGKNSMKHIFDIVVNVINYTAETTKNRFKQKGVLLPTAKFGQDFEKGTSELKIIRLNKRPDEDDRYNNSEEKKIV